MNRRGFLKTSAWSIGAWSLSGCAQDRFPSLSQNSKKGRPSLLYILADDLGYGDVSCLNEDSKIQTPHLDELAKDGMIFTDAHSGSAVCTPTRYGLLTGRYCWRSRLKKGVLLGYDSHLIEDDGRPSPRCFGPRDTTRLASANGIWAGTGPRRPIIRKMLILPSPFKTVRPPMGLLIASVFQRHWIWPRMSMLKTAGSPPLRIESWLPVAGKKCGGKADGGGL